MSKYRIVPVVTQPGENPVIDGWQIVNKDDDSVAATAESYGEALNERKRLEATSDGDAEDQTETAELALTDGHKHSVRLDINGNGVSSKNDGHSHRVLGGKVLLANGHLHRLVKPGAK